MPLTVWGIVFLPKSNTILFGMKSMILVENVYLCSRNAKVEVCEEHHN